MWCTRGAGILPRSVRSRSVPRKRSLHQGQGRQKKQPLHGVLKRQLSDKPQPPQSSNGTLKIVGGLTLALGGGFAGALYYASTHPEVREKLEHYVPFSSSLLDQIAIIPKNNNHEKPKPHNDMPSLLRPIKPSADQSAAKTDLPPPLIPVIVPPKEKTEKPTAASDTDEKKTDVLPKKEKPPAKKGKDSDAAIISAVDQPSISSVDLAIPGVTPTKKTADKPKQESAVKPAETAPKPVKEGQKTVVVLSAVDVPGVSSVDLDIPTKPVPKPDSKQPASVPPDDAPVPPAQDDTATPEPPSPTDSVQEDVKPPEPVEQETKEEVLQPVEDAHPVPPAPISAVEEAVVAPVSPPPVDLAPLQEQLSKEMERLYDCGTAAIEKHSDAAGAVHDHSQHVKLLLATEQGEEWDKVWSDCVSASHTSEQMQNDSTVSALKAHEQVTKVHNIIKEIRQLGGDDVVAETAQAAAKVMYDIQSAVVNLQQARVAAEVDVEQQKLLEEEKDKLKKDFLEFVSKDIQQQTQEGELNQSDAALVGFAQKRIEFLNKMLAARESEEKERLEHALTRQREEDQKLGEMQLEQEGIKLQQETQDKLSLLEQEMTEKHNSDLKQQLRRQAVALNDHMNDVLHVQHSELSAKHREELLARVKEEKDVFEHKLAQALARLRGVEYAVESRAEIDEMNRKAQELWIACKSLTSALSGTGLEQSDEKRVLKDQILAISEAGAGSPLVEQVLASIPSEVITTGVSTEEGLRSRFPKVQRVCRRVAAVGEEGQGLWSYALSYFQSFLVLNTFNAKKAEEPVDPAVLNNFDYLYRAEYCMSTGDIEQATRYMSQLKGVSRKVAQDWINEARVLLETKQAAALLTTYASACELGNKEQP